MVISKKILIPAIIFIIIVIAGLGGFFYFRNQDVDLDNDPEIIQKESNKKEIPTREQIEEKYKWDLSVFYKNNEDWEKDFAKLEKEYMPQFTGFVGQLNDPDQSLKCLKLVDESRLIAERLYYFATNTSKQNLSDSANSERLARATSMFSRFDEKLAFIDSELTALPEKTLQSYMANSEFSDYQHSLSVMLRQKEHILPKEQAELLAKSRDMSSSFSSIFSKLHDVDIEFPIIKDENNEDYQLSEARYMTALDSPNRDFRERAYKGLLGSYAKYDNTMSEVLSGKVKKNIFYARASKYDTALESFLNNDLIDEKIYNNLISSTADNLSYLHRYINLKKKVLNLDAVHQYDMYVPIVEELDIEIPYEEGKEMTLTALAPLGKKYVNDLATAFDNRWIDVYETKDKTTGAYCNANYEPHPFVLLNYNNKFSDLKTLAHEMGHAFNFYYTGQVQPYPMAGMQNFNAEIPSTINEILMLKYFINNAQTDDEKLYYLNNFAEAVYSSFYTQVMFSEFELKIHERIEKGEALSADFLDNLWGDIVIKYAGPDYILDEEVKSTWVRVPHFYVYDFYVYRYATSMAAANEFAKRILNGEDGVSEKYNVFLSAGSSDYPLEILKQAGIDMTNSDLYDNLLSEFNNTLTEMEIILKKQGRI
ncbi:MAG: oligoendopeptidase F [Patescibacteria group bacterium]